MPFNVPSFQTIRDELLRDLVSLNPAADINQDSDYYVRASSIASCVSGNYAHQSWIVKQIFPDTSDSQYLAMHAGLRQLFKRKATVSTATITITGDTDSVLPKDSEIKPKDSEIIFTTNEQCKIIKNGTATVIATAKKVGKQSNIVNQQATLLSAPAGIQSIVLISNAIGGTDLESDQSLLSRLLDRLRTPPAGGNKNDYKQWALSVSGVENAYVYPLRRGLGTVDIVITTKDGLASDSTLNKVKTLIDNLRPVTAKDIAVISPIIKSLNITASIKSSTNIDQLKLVIKQNIDAFFEDLEPGQSLIKSQIESVISETVGVIDRNLTSPANNLLGDQDGRIIWYRLQTLTLEPLS